MGVGSQLVYAVDAFDDATLQNLSVPFTGDVPRKSRSVVVNSGAQLTVENCDLRGQVLAKEGAELRLKTSRVHESGKCGLLLSGTTHIKDCVVEGSLKHGIAVTATGQVTVSGTKVTSNSQNGVQVEGDGAIKDSSITLNGWNGVAAWQRAEILRSKGICIIGDNVECSGNILADYVTRAGHLPGAPQERIVVVD